ncbi:MAG TPA: hypothetical protein VK815_11760 [Candidatus Acidoferrales bacterium]|nr:hypothetical protein [Candidatus Acidoferrales bacterium]
MEIYGEHGSVMVLESKLMKLRETKGPVKMKSPRRQLPRRTPDQSHALVLLSVTKSNRRDSDRWK